MIIIYFQAMHTLIICINNYFIYPYLYINAHNNYLFALMITAYLLLNCSNYFIFLLIL